MRHIVSGNEALGRTLYRSHTDLELQRGCRLNMAICSWSICGRYRRCWYDGSALRTHQWYEFPVSDSGKEVDS